jgi:hypothetical protein
LGPIWGRLWPTLGLGRLAPSLLGAALQSFALLSGIFLR